MAILNSHTHSSQDTRNLISKKKQRMNLDEPTHLIKNQDEQKKKNRNQSFISQTLLDMIWKNERDYSLKSRFQCNNLEGRNKYGIAQCNFHIWHVMSSHPKSNVTDLSFCS